MTVLVNGASPAAAWRAGVAELLTRSEIHNLLTTIDSPTDLDPGWLTAYSPRRRGMVGDDVREVAKTIFPFDLVQQCATRVELYAEYLRRHDRAMRWQRNRAAWGTYFERLIRFPGPKPTNQLERAIEKLTSWPKRSTTGLVFHLSSPSVDTPRTRGGPCWHFAELIWRADEHLDLVVVYRNHDFFNKALGNFIGLGQLLKFIATSAGKGVGSLTCHSVHAYNGGSVHNMRALIA